MTKIMHSLSTLCQVYSIRFNVLFPSSVEYRRMLADQILAFVNGISY